VKGINVPGYHLHFISNDFTKGGHILDFKMKSGKCEIDFCHQFLLTLPEDGDEFSRVDL